LTASSDAILQDFITRLASDIDLRFGEAANRRTGEDWQVFPSEFSNLSQYVSS
jgi:hypothetical protein